MPKVSYPLIRKLLFRMDPERAHAWTLNALNFTASTPLRSLWEQPRINDPVVVAGLQFPNRIGLAAGLDKDAHCIDALSMLGFGFVEVGTVTPKPQAGNPKPRMFRLPKAQALINRLGFNNKGLNRFIANVEGAHFRQNHPDMPMILGLNIGKNASTPIEEAHHDYLTCLEGVYPHADYITVNISSPNTQNLRTLQSDSALDQLLQRIAQRREQLMQLHGKKVPLFVKIAPDLNSTQVKVIAQTLVQHGMDGVIATNTTITRHAVKGLPYAEETGGLSGRPVLSMSNQIIARLRSELGPDFPIIGVGGVMSSQDAISKLEAGANLVQIYTGLIYAGPELITRCATAAQKYHQHRR